MAVTSTPGNWRHPIPCTLRLQLALTMPTLMGGVLMSFFRTVQLRRHRDLPIRVERPQLDGLVAAVHAETEWRGVEQRPVSAEAEGRNGRLRIGVDEMLQQQDRRQGPVNYQPGVAFDAAGVIPV